MSDHILYECGICDGLHPWDWDGDCRDIVSRYADIEGYIKYNPDANPTNIEIRSWQDRLDADDAENENES